MSTEKSTKVITGKVRFSYLNVFEAKVAPGSTVAKFSVSLLINKKDKTTLAKINEAIELAIQQGITSKWGGKKPKNLKIPLRDGDEEREDDENYHGVFFLNCSSLQKPGLVDENADAIMDSTELYSGCFGRASINFFPFNTNGNMGIAAGLNNLQKLADGEPLGGGRTSAEEDFGAQKDAF